MLVKPSRLNTISEASRKSVIGVCTMNYREARRPEEDEDVTPKDGSRRSMRRLEDITSNSVSQPTIRSEVSQLAGMHNTTHPRVLSLH